MDRVFHCASSDDASSGGVCVEGAFREGDASVLRLSPGLSANSASSTFSSSLLSRVNASSTLASDATSSKRSLPLKSLNHVSIHCQDVRESLKFYCDLMGFVPIKRPSCLDYFDGAWLFNYGIGIHLLKDPMKQSETKRSRTAADINPCSDHVSFQCEDIEAVGALLEERGVPYIRQAVEEHGLLVQQLFFHDPDGHMIEICNCDVLPVVPLQGVPPVVRANSSPEIPHSQHGSVSVNSSGASGMPCLRGCSSVPKASSCGSRASLESSGMQLPLLQPSAVAVVESSGLQLPLLQSGTLSVACNQLGSSPETRPADEGLPTSQGSGPSDALPQLEFQSSNSDKFEANGVIPCLQDDASSSASGALPMSGRAAHEDSQGPAAPSRPNLLPVSPAMQHSQPQNSPAPALSYSELVTPAPTLAAMGNSLPSLPQRGSIFLQQQPLQVPAGI